MLTDPQRRTWVELYGEPFDFSYDTYFPSEANFQTGTRGTTPDLNNSATNNNTATGATAAGSDIGVMVNPGQNSGIGTANPPGGGVNQDPTRDRETPRGGVRSGSGTPTPGAGTR